MSIIKDRPIGTDERIAELEQMLASAKQTYDHAHHAGDYGPAATALRAMKAIREDLDFALDSRRAIVIDYEDKSATELTDIFVETVRGLPDTVLERVLLACIEKLGCPLVSAEVERIHELQKNLKKDE